VIVWEANEEITQNGRAVNAVCQ